MDILKSKIWLYTFLFIVAFIGWYNNTLEKKFAKKYDIIIILFIETLAILLSLSLILIYKYTQDPALVKKSFSSIDFTDYLLFIYFSVFGIGGSYLGLEFLKFHGVSTMRISSFIISVPVTSIWLYYSPEKFTTDKLIGLIMVVFGGYFFMK